MQRIFSALGQARQYILVVGMLSLVLSSLLVVAQPTLAAPISSEGQKLIQQEKLDKESQVANQRAQSYEEQVEAAKDVDKVYEDNLKAYKESHPGENIVDKAVQGAEKLVDKVAGDK